MDCFGGALLSGHVQGLRIEQAKVVVTCVCSVLRLSVEYMHEQPGVYVGVSGKGDSSGGRAGDPHGESTKRVEFVIMNLKGKRSFPSSCALSGVVITSCRVLLVCSCLIFMNK